MIAMAGPHQIWTLDLVTDEVRVWAGSGMENIIDGSSTTAAFAQPSGLATDGQFLYVADSEVSGIRAVSFKDAGREQVRTVVGRGLFVFGDTDGRGSEVRLQHCLGVAFADGKLYIADSYNNKIKVCEPKDREVKAFVGTREPGAKDDPPQFDQPGGLSIADGTLYVADTNNHAIRAIDLGTKAVRTLKLTGIAPPVPQAPRFPNAAVADLDPVEVAPGPRFTLKVTIPLPPGFKINPDGTMPYLLETPGKEEALDPVARRGVRLRPPTQTFTAMVPLARPSKPGEQLNVRLSVGAFICREGKEGICTVKNHTWNIPVKFVAGASETAAVRPAQAAAAGEGND
jgi:hypothetical protein